MSVNYFLPSIYKIVYLIYLYVSINNINNQQLGLACKDSGNISYTRFTKKDRSYAIFIA